MEAVVIRRSPVVIIRNLIILQIGVTVFYFLLALAGNYGELYQEYNFARLLSYELAKTLFIGIGEGFLIMLIFMRWFFHIYVIHPDMIVIEKGIIFKKRRVIKLPTGASINCHHSALAKVFRYGRLIFRNAEKEEILTISAVPDVEIYQTKIKQLISRVDSSGKTSLEELLKNYEQQQLEFKTSFRWDVKENKLNKNLEKATLKTIAAFLNADGGNLILGINDQRQAVGLEADYDSLNRKDADGFENHFTGCFKAVIGAEFRRFIDVSFHQVDNREICWIKVAPGVKPAYARFDNGEFFFVRTGNSTTAMPLSEAADYIRSRFD